MLMLLFEDKSDRCMKTCCVHLLLFEVGVRGHHACPLGGILSILEPPEWLQGLEKCPLNPNPQSGEE